MLHDRDAEWHREKRRSLSEVTIQPVADAARRRDCELNTPLWLRTYFPDKFYMDFAPDQLAMIEAVEQALLFGGDQAIAGPRGCGKSTLTECLTVKCVVTGRVKFAVVIAASAKHADRILGNIKKDFETNPLLAADYPEVCNPIWALEGRYQRCSSQRHNGKSTEIVWTKEMLGLPKIGGSKASGSVLVAAGIDSGVRGLNVGGLRPDLVLIDDPETEESAWSPTQVETRERIIEHDLAGLGGPQKQIARVFLCTLVNRECLASKFTDPKLKPSWRGRRYKSLLEWPTNRELWDEYINVWNDNRELDPTSRLAHSFYLANRERMDAGAVVANPQRFSRQIMPDGSEKEASALQACFNVIARYGMESFMSEEQNEPPEEDKPEGTGISEAIVARRVNYFDQRVVPDGCVAITAAIDCGKWRIHWTVVAWKMDATGYVIDYGTRDVYPGGDNDDAIERALLKALHEQREAWEAEPYADKSGEIFPIRVCLVDSGDYQDAVYRFVREVGGKRYRASKGFGESIHTRGRSRFLAPPKSTPDKLIGDHWFLAKQKAGLWIVGMDADYWKLWVHNRFLTPPDRPGSITLWGEKHRTHVVYSRQIVAEQWEEQPFREGKKPKTGFVRKSRDNHFLDTTYGCACGASLLHIKLLGDTRRRSAVPVAAGAVAGEEREGGSGGARRRKKKNSFALEGGRQWQKR